MTAREDSVKMFSKYLHDRVFENIRGVAPQYDHFDDLMLSEYATQWLDQCLPLNSDVRETIRQTVITAIREAWEDVTE